MKIDVILHSEDDSLGFIQEWADKHHHELVLHRPTDSDGVQTIQPHRVNLLISLGGGELLKFKKTAWFAVERELMRRLSAFNIPQFGIGIGAQQLASALGGTITSMAHQTAGWQLVNATRADTVKLPDLMTVFQEPHDRIVMPRAQRLFNSALDHCQGFKFKNAVGLQFHLEVMPETQRQLAGGGDSKVNWTTNQRVLDELLDTLVKNGTN
ncbi:type 1 glutamine amidotransferase [Levilactobacillus bambusae]|nr:gamma-glutamyl-gamma-aminobutyrate hydrolase family protein [Levilactobacillus bambusae]